MKNKLQVFVSSTFTDLLDERQAIVEAILMAGHIPAGMELFAAGDKSQLETIRRWIEESDVFMLVLGGRYGTIEPESKKSYIHLEYEYALDKGKPVFAAVITKEYLERKVKEKGPEVIETRNGGQYEDFRKIVLSRTCRFFDDAKDLKLIVHESIPSIVRDADLSGWVRGDEVTNPRPMFEEISALRKENSTLSAQVAALQARQADELFNGLTFDNLCHQLRKEKLEGERLTVNVGLGQSTSLLNDRAGFSCTGITCELAMNQ